MKYSKQKNDFRNHGKTCVSCAYTYLNRQEFHRSSQREMPSYQVIIEYVFSVPSFTDIDGFGDIRSGKGVRQILTQLVKFIFISFSKFQCQSALSDTSQRVSIDCKLHSVFGMTRYVTYYLQKSDEESQQFMHLDFRVVYNLMQLCLYNLHKNMDLLQSLHK